MGDAEIAGEGAIRSDFVIFGERKGIASFPRWSRPPLFSMNWQKEQGRRAVPKFKVPGSRFKVAGLRFAIVGWCVPDCEGRSLAVLREEGMGPIRPIGLIGRKRFGANLEL
jgi:hypothetical protein